MALHRLRKPHFRPRQGRFSRRKSLQHWHRSGANARKALHFEALRAPYAHRRRAPFAHHHAGWFGPRHATSADTAVGLNSATYVFPC
jgi:hypothetical protein